MASPVQGISLPQNKISSIPETQTIDIVWKNLSVVVNQETTFKTQINDSSIPLLSSQRAILDDVSGFAKAGEMTAIMGPSGAGKTTLMACLSNRFKKTSKMMLVGEILANNQPFKNYNEFGGFVMQDNLLMASLTVKETFLFVARLKIEGSTMDRLSKVDQVIKDLHLRNCQNTYVGDHIIKGISGGEKKRTSIGVEMISDPPVLILDEPTSGLDSFTAYTCMNLLKNIAKKQQRTIIFTIHQPSTDIYDLFDHLLILNNGQTVYQGKADQLISYCKQINLHIDTYSNPLDTVMNNMNQIINEEETLVTNQNYKYFLESSNIYTNQNGVNGYLKRRTKHTFLTELTVLVSRQMINYVRSPNILKAKCFGAIYMIIVLGWLFWDIEDSQPPTTPELISEEDLLPYLQNMTGAMYVCGTSAFFSTLHPLLALFPAERQIFLKEENSKLYKVWTYFFSKVMLETPINILIQLCISFWIYYAFSLNWHFHNLMEFMLITIAVSLCGNGIGIFIGCLFSDSKRAQSFTPAVIMPLQLFGGQLVVLTSLSKWISWVQYISPFKYFLEGFGRTQLNDVRFNLGLGYDVDPMILYGRTFGLWNCIYVLLGIAICFHIFALIALKLLINRINV